MDALIPLTTSGSLVDCVDKKIIVVLRDGRKLIGVLRSYDQFANLVMEDTVERIHHANSYGDIPRGVFLIRGENVVLLGEIDLDAEDEVPIQPAPVEVMMDLNRQEVDDRKRRENIKATVLYEEKGFCKEGGEGDGY
ncbi:Sm-like ribonucleoprotein [Clavulina sp. PMI_390]|nr:Sm-like ribonucleoprotein [Clavulina sp. PMI_390]